MATQAQLDFLIATAKAAQAAHHVWPEAAACEAAVETAWGTSQGYLKANNLFGMKQHEHALYGSIVLPTREYIHGIWRSESDAFVLYPSVEACFADRMDTLKRLSGAYPHYAAALAATNPQEYLRQVSQSWSTDQLRAQTCIKILMSHGAAMQAALNPPTQETPA